MKGCSRMDTNKSWIKSISRICIVLGSVIFFIGYTIGTWSIVSMATSDEKNENKYYD